MIESSIARRYAKALLELGKENNQAQAYLDQLEGFYAGCQANKDLMDALSNRFLDLKARTNVVNEVCQKIQASEIVCNFIKLLIQKGRIELFGLIVSTYRRFVLDHLNKLEATVISARALSDAEYEEIRKAYSQITGKDVVLRKEIKPEVLGGVAVKVGGVIYDGTVRKDVEKLSRRMMAVV